ncbi:anti-sigma factor family protein [Streptomyces sp. NPDC020681]|uniref:anti-sigma factor family protein n=1 Tax=Streptomyces sp. NPDC020681 TaxID=3365083 RepID=UPI0037AD6D0B
MTSTADMTQHPDVSEISDLTEGLLSPSRTADLQQHLDSCPLCADVRASLEEIRGLLGTLPGASRMPADIAERIDAALAAEALLDSTVPEESAHVSRETSPTAPQPETTSADRPAGHARGATGPGRGRHARKRRKVVLGTVFGAAAVGMSLLFFQQVKFTGDNNTASQDQGASSRADAAAQSLSASSLEGRVKALVASSPARDQTKIEKGPSIEGQTRSAAPDKMEMTSQEVPPCIQKGTGRTDAPIAFERDSYEGENGPVAVYLVVFPHTTDNKQVQAYVIDAACADTGSAPTGKLLLTDAYPRR